MPKEIDAMMVMIRIWSAMMTTIEASNTLMRKVVIRNLSTRLYINAFETKIKAF